MEGIEEYQKIAEDEASYYGDFRVTACKGTAATYAMSQEEIDDRIGTMLSYSASFYVCNGNSMDVSQDGYTGELYPIEEMALNYNVEASDLGIINKEILAVSILMEGEFFGNYFYVVDENTLLIYYEGVFLRLTEKRRNYSKKYIYQYTVESYSSVCRKFCQSYRLYTACYPRGTNGNNKTYYFNKDGITSTPIINRKEPALYSKGRLLP